MVVISVGGENTKLYFVSNKSVCPFIIQYSINVSLYIPFEHKCSIVNHNVLI